MRLSSGRVLADVRRFELPGGGPDVRISLLDWGGEGAPALLHHANGFCAAPWDEISRALRPRYRVFALDARGHGESSAPGDPEAYAWPRFADAVEAVAGALARELGRPLALGLGHSFGGTATLAAAARRPELFEALVLVDPVIHAPTPPGEPAGSDAGAALAERARRRRRRFASREEAARHFDSRELFAAWTPRARALYVAHGLRDAEGGVELACAPEMEAAIFERGARFDVWAAVPHLAQPVFFLRAARGPSRHRRTGRSRRARGTGGWRRWKQVTSCRWSGPTSSSQRSRTSRGAALSARPDSRASSSRSSPRPATPRARSPSGAASAPRARSGCRRRSTG